jgi:EAL domain-containing protein (putative c-di-GMP-specific phosphodiesterase class I)
MLQGYLYSKPLPFNETVAFIKAYQAAHP